MEKRISKIQTRKINHLTKRKNSKIRDGERKILKAIEKFNEIRDLKAKAELVEFKDKKFLIKFSGHICVTCGTDDYLEDLILELEDLCPKTKIINYQNFINYFKIEYQILN